MLQPSRGVGLALNCKVTELASSAAEGFGEERAMDPARKVERLFREHNRALVGFLSARLGSEHEAREVAQEAYVRLLRLDHPTASSFLRAHLFHIAANLAIDRLRQRAVRARTSLEDLFQDLLFTPTPESQALASEEMDVMRRALRELPAKSARAFALYMLVGRDVRSIAREMRMPERSVRWHVQRAFEHCRSRLEEYREQ
jgi:RNA polymerase sigma factor (sigma-70 family)